MLVDVGDDFARARRDIVVDLSEVEAFAGIGRDWLRGAEGVSSVNLEVFGHLFEIVEGGDVAGDVARAHGDGGEVEHHVVLVD